MKTFFVTFEIIFLVVLTKKSALRVGIERAISTLQVNRSTD
jgi:hypothetical protein